MTTSFRSMWITSVCGAAATFSKCSTATSSRPLPVDAGQLTVHWSIGVGDDGGAAPFCRRLRSDFRFLAFTSIWWYRHRFSLGAGRPSHPFIALQHLAPVKAAHSGGTGFSKAWSRSRAHQRLATRVGTRSADTSMPGPLGSHAP